MQARPELTINSSYREICEKLSQLTTSNICDALGNIRLMDTEIDPVGDIQQCVGMTNTHKRLAKAMVMFLVSG